MTCFLSSLQDCVLYVCILYSSIGAMYISMMLHSSPSTTIFTGSSTSLQQYLFHTPQMPLVNENTTPYRVIMNSVL